MRSTRNSWRRAAAAVLAGLALVLAAPAPARADADAIERMSADLNLPKVTGQYIFLVDTSGSMRRPVDLYSGVKDAMGRLLAAADPDDDLALVSFDRTARIWTGKVGRTPDSVLDHLPPSADGDYTDIGSALEKAVGELERPDAPPVATVVMLTDGVHNKAPYSAYPFKTGASWDRLRERAARAAQTKESVTAFGIPLGPKTDSSLLSSVFPDAQVLATASVDQLTERFKQPRQALLAAKARSALAGDLKAGISVEWPEQTLRPGTSTVTLTLRNTAQRLPLTAARITARSSDKTVELRVPDGTEVDLPPGGRPVTVTGTLRWTPPANHTPWHMAKADARMRFAADVGSKYRPVLENDLGLKPAWGFTDNPGSFRGSRQVGHPYFWAGGGAIALLVAGVGWLAWWIREHPRLQGSLRISCPYPARPLHQCNLSGRRFELNPQLRRTLQGSARVRARWSNSNHNEAVTQLVVTYWPNAAPERKVKGVIDRGTYLIINGVRFDWVAA